MTDFDVTILTDDIFLNASESKAFLEDQIVKDALESKGFKVARVSWADRTFDWSSTSTALFRTTWDYFHRPDEWQEFLNLISSQTQLINPIEMVRWNMDKHYLGDLSKRGLEVPETLYLEVGETRSLSELLDETNWQDAILKPCFAGTARHTYRLNPKNVDNHESNYAELIQREAFMLQPFLQHVTSRGEISLVIIGGEYSHAVIKKAKSGDFRVQSDFGGSVELYEPTSQEIAFAIDAVAHCDALPTYARVDIVLDNQNRLSLIELELIEPELWFRLKPEAAMLLANSIKVS